MSKPKVFVTKDVPIEAIQMLEKTCEVVWHKSDETIDTQELCEAIKDCDGLFCLSFDKITKEVIEHSPKLKVIATMSVGIDHLDIPTCRERKIALGFTPSVLTEATAELTTSLLLATSRRLIEANAYSHTGKWEWGGGLWMCGRGIHNSTVGIIGFGRIGSTVARQLSGFDPKEILYYDPFPVLVAAAAKVGAIKSSLDELLRKSDFVVTNVFLCPETRHMMNSEAFAKMKSTAVYVNTSRGPVVDQEALYAALTTGQIRAAGLDVCYPEPLPADHKLLKLNNFVLLPHIGSATIEARTRMATLTAENILAGLEGNPLPSPIPE